ncbi:ArnT family glycosyltransferase [Chloroflexus islandicus]|nr:glycosyltransferase family 39 protein [Chloroflexus islandicus]
MPALWYQQRQLAMVSLPYGDAAPPYYPMNANLFYLWLILPFDTIAVADIGQAPFALLAAVSVYAIARQLDLSPVVARRAGILTLFVPMVSATAGLWSTNDVIFAAIWLLSLAMVQRAARTATLRDLVLASIALGLTIGTKGFALTFGILLAPWLAWAWWRYGRSSWQRLGYGAIAMIIPLSVLASFSYVRNWLLTGNPLYPYRFMFGWIALPGLVDRQWFYGHPFFEFDARLLFFEPGYANLGLLLLVAIPSLSKVVFRPHPWRRSTIILLGLAAGYFVLFSELLPIRATRFLLPAMLLLLIVVVIGLEQIDKHRLKERFYLAYVIIGSLLVFLITVHTMGTNLFEAAPTSLHIDAGTWRPLWDVMWHLNWQTELQYLLLIEVSIGVLIVIGRALERWGWRSLPFIGLAVIVAFATGLEHYDRREYDAYTRLPYANVGQLWRWVNAHTTGQRIAYLGGNIPLPLMGHHLKNVVTAVNVGAGDLLHEIEVPVPADQPIRTYPDNRSDVPDQAVWLQHLRDKQIDLVVVYELIPVDWPEVQWMRNNPDQFELWYRGRGGSVWRVRR